MQELNVERLRFGFPDAWQVAKYDDWPFYRNQIARMWNGIKAVDLLAVDSDRTAWFIEVKDYRINRRTKPSDLGEEVAHKVFDTLAAILPAKINANDADERKLARAVASAHALKVVLHLEQPAKHSKLFPRAINPANVELKLRQLLKPVDAHPLVVETSSMRGLEWRVI